MLVFGKNVFYELNNNASNIRKIYISNTFRDQKIFDLIKKNNLNYLKVDNKKLDYMVDGNHQGIIIEINDYEYSNLDSILNDNFIVMLDHLEDPHNLGAIIRTCESASVNSIIIPKDRSVQVNGTVMKVSSGALERVNVVQVKNLVNAINTLKDNGFFIYGADMLGNDYKQNKYPEKIVLVIGNEGSGLSKLIKDNCDELIKISMSGEINSLNASVATGILIYGIKDLQNEIWNRWSRNNYVN